MSWELEISMSRKEKGPIYNFKLFSVLGAILSLIKILKFYISLILKSIILMVGGKYWGMWRKEG